MGVPGENAEYVGCWSVRTRVWAPLTSACRLLMQRINGFVMASSSVNILFLEPEIYFRSVSLRTHPLI